MVQVGGGFVELIQFREWERVSSEVGVARGVNAGGSWRGAAGARHGGECSGRRRARARRTAAPPPRRRLPPPRAATHAAWLKILPKLCRDSLNLV